MSEEIVTIVVVPRERFSHALRSLESIYADTAFPFRLVYVDGRSPRKVRRGLERRASELGFRLIRENRYLTPNQARNIGLREVRTKYVVFIDNDALVSPGWLAPLVRCAEETGAWVCGPLCLEGPFEEQMIHVAGGDVSIESEEGRRYLRDDRRHAGRRVPDVLPLLRREPCEHVELHCLLARTDIFERLGPLDEGLRAVFEHCDLCLCVRESGGEIYFEPASVVTYVSPPPLPWSDVPYFTLRWSEEWIEASVERFRAKWALDRTDPHFDATVNFCRWHRRILFRRLRAAYHRVPGRTAERVKSRVLMPIESGLRRSVVRWTQRGNVAAGEPVAIGAPKPDEHAAVRADQP
jgi:GT2 family glycosyltransferase